VGRPKPTHPENASQARGYSKRLSMDILAAQL